MFGVQVFDRESPLTNRRCRDVQSLLPPLRARVSRWTEWRPGQSVENIVAVPIEAHQRLNAFYSSKQPNSYPNTVRESLRGQSFEAQYEFGMAQLKRVLGF